VSFRRRYILEGNSTFYVFAGEHGRVLPLYKYPDVRRGHGRKAKRRGLRVRKQLIWYGDQSAWRLLEIEPQDDKNSNRLQLRVGNDGGSRLTGAPS
jgi:hypothetical protein